MVTFVRENEIGFFPGNSCYGSVVMPSIIDNDIEYKFNLELIKKGTVIGIGIDNAECKWINENYSLQPSQDPPTKFYSYISNTGDLYSWSDPSGVAYGEIYGTGDVVTMIYNPYKSQLLFETNGKKQKIIENVYGRQGLSYRTC